jgi:hypothetical protein
MKVPIDESTTSDGGVEEYSYLEMRTGDRARLVVPDFKVVVDGGRKVLRPDPEFANAEWVHELKPPTVVDGRVLKETRNRKSGGTYETYQYGFKGRPICLGTDEAIRANGGLDPSGVCPACRDAIAYSIPELAPERRYAVPVI